MCAQGRQIAAARTKQQEGEETTCGRTAERGNATKREKKSKNKKGREKGENE